LLDTPTAYCAAEDPDERNTVLIACVLDEFAMLSEGAGHSLGCLSIGVLWRIAGEKIELTGEHNDEVRRVIQNSHDEMIADGVSP